MKKIVVGVLALLVLSGFAFAESVEMSAEVGVKKCALVDTIGGGNGRVNWCQIPASSFKNIEIELVERTDEIGRTWWEGTWDGTAEEEGFLFSGFIKVRKSYECGEAFYVINAGVREVVSSVSPLPMEGQISVTVNSMDQLNRMTLTGTPILSGVKGPDDPFVFVLTPTLYLGPKEF